MEKPRERARKRGISALSDSELIAILLRTGKNGKDVTTLAREVWNAFDGSFLRMERGNTQEFMRISGMGMAKSLTLQAALEIGKRMWRESVKNRKSLRKAEDVFEVCKDMTLFKVEKVRVLLLDAKSHLMAYKDLSVGTAMSSLIHPREIFSFAVSYPTAAMILVHNHPSGDPTPSESDKKVTKRISKACEIMEMRFLDHVIISPGGYFSFSENLM